MRLKSLNSACLAYYENISDVMYDVDVLIKAAKSCCQTREFKGEYYGIPKDFVNMLSNERNEYISLLTLASDKLKYANTLNQGFERNLRF